MIYSRNTETFEVDNLRFTHISVFSDKADYPHFKKIDDKTEIALYHGVVTGIDFGGFKVTAGEMSCGEFDGYDMVLLGDIHSAQTLQPYAIDEMEIDEAELPNYLKDGWNVKK